MEKRVEEALKVFKDFPKKGILFYDIFPVLADPDLWSDLVNYIAPKIKGDVIVGLESRGFLLGVAIATYLRKPFIPIRKKGKLPGVLHQADYEKEYGLDSLYIQTDALKANSTVCVIDDLIATGGSARAVQELINKCHAKVAQFVFMVELDELNGRERLEGEILTIVHK